MNILVLEDKDILSQLIEKRVLKPFSGKQYRMNIEGILFDVYSDIDDIKTAENNDDKNTSSNVKLHNGHINLKQLKDHYNKFLSSFPVSDKFDSFRKNRTLRSDPMNVGFDRYRKLVQEHNIHPDHILSALEYEVYYRKKESRVQNENLMKYMQGLGPWLNNVVNIKTQLEEIENDEEYANNPEGIIEDPHDDL